MYEKTKIGSASGVLHQTRSNVLCNEEDSIFWLAHLTWILEQVQSFVITYTLPQTRITFLLDQTKQ